MEPDWQTTLTTAVIPAAGAGTRMDPATRAIPKPLLPLIDIPLIELAVTEAVQAGIRRLIVIAPPGGLLQRHFARSNTGKLETGDSARVNVGPIKITWLIQREPLGLGHAVALAKPLLPTNRRFALLLPDVVPLSPSRYPGPYPLEQLARFSELYDRPCVSIQEIDAAEASAHGCAQVKQLGPEMHLIERVVEKPTRVDSPTAWILSGRYVLAYESLKYIPENQPVGQEVDLSSALNWLAHSRCLLGITWPGSMLDCGTPSGYAMANASMALRRPDIRARFAAHMKFEMQVHSDIFAR